MARTLRGTGRRTLVCALAAAVLALAAPFARADIYIVVNAANSVSTLSQNEALDLFMGRSRHFTGGKNAQTFDLARNSAARETFYKLLTGMDMPQVNSYWARLMFSGQTLPPQPVTSEDAMADLLKRTPGAIGYLTQPPADKALTVVLVLKDPR